MRLLLISLVSTLLLAGCAKDPEDWTMSPDGFGPITVDTTKKEALATGAYKVAEPPCSATTLAWHTQPYKSAKRDEGGDGKRDRWPTGPYLPSISFNYDKPGIQFIDPGADTATDLGIRPGDSEAKLKKAYGDTLITADDRDPDAATYAVNGKRSYLLINVVQGKVEGFFVVPGTIKGQKDFLIGRGGFC